MLLAMQLAKTVRKNKVTFVVALKLDKVESKGKILSEVLDMLESLTVVMLTKLPKKLPPK